MPSYIKHWRRLGETNPYYAVLTDPRFAAREPGPAEREAFFAGGEAWIEMVMRELTLEGFEIEKVERALDYGCGVGRLLPALAKRSAEVVGADISQPMLDEAAANLERMGVAGVELLRVGDPPVELEGRRFELIVSSIVLQHVPVARGLAIFDRLLDALAPGGSGAIHFNLRAHVGAPRWRRLLRRARAGIPGVHELANLARGASWREPYMEMNDTPLDEILIRLRRRGIEGCRLITTDHGGCLGAIVLFTSR